MSQDRSGQIEELYYSAVELGPSDRRTFLVGACAGDMALVSEVESLFAQRASSSVHSEDRTQFAHVPEPAGEQLRPGRRVGTYQLLHLLGMGGMGSVYAASRADQEYKQIVAIKLVNSELHSEKVLRRFRRERQLLANLEHPYIAQLLDGGTAEDGAPYLVMEFVKGQRIDDYCKSKHLSLRSRLKLFQQVCEAVQYAHQHLVIHGDIKPGNILVSKTGVPKLLDFGIARLITTDCSNEEIGPGKGDEQPMTLRYASPEQIRGGSLGTSSDQYSLGVVLYELLTGRHPFHKTLDGPMTKTILAERSPDGPITAWLRRAEMERAILAEEAQKPSGAVVENAGGIKIEKDSQRSLIRLSRELHGDLDCIILKSLSKQPHERYSSVQCLSDDIDRYLSGYPVTPRKRSSKYRAGKFARRHLAGVTAALLVITAIITATIVSLRFAQTAMIQRSKAVDRFNNARKLARFVLFDFDDVVHEGVTPARKRLVAEALGYLNRLSEHTPGDPTFERDIIEGYLKVGDLQGNPIYSNLGGSAAAKESYVKALHVAESLSAKDPGDSRARMDVARANVKLTDLLSGDITERLKSYRQWQQVFESLVPNYPQAKLGLELVTERIGTVQFDQGDLGGALESYSRYLHMAEEIYQATPSDDSRRSVALAYEKVGNTMMNTGATDEGLLKLQHARLLYDQIVTANPTIRARKDLATFDAVIGDTLGHAQRYDDAIKSLLQALDNSQKLVAEDPENNAYQQLKYDVLWRLAIAYYKVGKPKEARQSTMQVLAVLKPMLAVPEPGEREIEQYCEVLFTTPFADLRQPVVARQFASHLDAEYLDMLARAVYAADDAALAVEIEKKALAQLPGNVMPERKKLLETSLAKFSARPETKE